MRMKLCYLHPIFLGFFYPLSPNKKILYINSFNTVLCFRKQYNFETNYDTFFFRACLFSLKADLTNHLAISQKILQHYDSVGVSQAFKYIFQVCY